VLAGLFSPLPILFLVGKSEASKLGLSFIAGPAPSAQPADTQAPLLRQD
jgi:hypothetical protein